MSARLPLSLRKNSLYDVLSEYFFVTVKDDTMEALSWMIVLFVALFCFYKRLAGIWSSAIISAALVFAGSCSQLSLTTVYVMAVTWVMVVTLFIWPLLRQTILTKHFASRTSGIRRRRVLV